MFIETDYLNDELWKVIMKYYIKLIQRLWPGRDNLLLLDKLKAHMQPDVAAECLKNGVHTFYLVPNASHFIQPLDDNMFTNFKRILGQETRKFIEELAMNNLLLGMLL